MEETVKTFDFSAAPAPSPVPDVIVAAPAPGPAPVPVRPKFLPGVPTPLSTSKPFKLRFGIRNKF